MRRQRFTVAPLLLALVALAATSTLEVQPPIEKRSTRFAVLGDTGTGDKHQRDVAAKLVESRAVFPFDFAIMLGDNLYGDEDAEDYRKKFEIPYAPLLKDGVRFYASLGNHDEVNQRFYEPFNMKGERYYTFTEGPIRFFALDSNYMDPEQVAWFERELRNSRDRWKITFFHHPPYSPGAKHGSEEDLRQLIEPLMVKYGVDVVFTGHEHFYARLMPQNGIYYFIAGASAKLRRGDIQPSPLTARGYDQGRSFMLIEIWEDNLRFQTIADTGKRVDAGILPRPADPEVELTAETR